jgi:hypothetical protein
MAKIPIQIGARFFKTKTEAKNFARSIMARWADGEIISGLDDLFLRDLVALHHEAAAKIGCGIEHFTIQRDPVWGNTRHFLIIRTDGSFTDVSFHTCIDGSNERRDVFHALRHAVSEQVIEFQQAAFSGDILPICPYTQEILVMSDAHVDHMPPNTFFALATRWMEQNGLSTSDIPLVENADNQWVRAMRRAEQAESWRAFHQKYARLRIISRPANLSRVKYEHRIDKRPV